MTAAVPHEKNPEDEDRSFTFARLARLAEPDLPEDERDEIATTLECLDDPRAEQQTTRRALGQPRWNPETAEAKATRVSRAGEGGPGRSRARG